MKPVKIVIAAGTGFLGQVLIAHFRQLGHEVVVLTRGNANEKDGVRYLRWNAKTLGPWVEALEGADVLVNLAGKSVDCRYTEANRKEILASRIDSTRILNQAVLACTNPPRHWLNSSTATIYRHSEDRQMDEYEGEIGSDFSMDVAKAWEAAFFETDTPRTLKTALRTSIVLGRDGGAFLPLKNLAKAGFGGRQGSGRQFVSWVHGQDFARAVRFIIAHQMTGAVNVVAPEPVRNARFMRQLRRTVGMRFGFPIGQKLLGFGARLIGTEAELVLKSRNVIPKRLTDAGFNFTFGRLEDAFRDLLK